jgi:hypothetical protein
MTMKNPGAYSLVAYADHNGVPTNYRIRRGDIAGTTVGVVTRTQGGWIVRRQCRDGSYRSLGVHATPEGALGAYTEYAAEAAAEPTGPRGPAR